MDAAPCRVVYVNRCVDHDRLVRAKIDSSADAASTSQASLDLTDVQPLLETFGDVHVCSSGSACLSKVFEDEDSYVGKLTPTLVLIDMPLETTASDHDALPTPNTNIHQPRSEAFDIHAPDEELYGLNLLQKLISESLLRNMSKMVIPVAVITSSQSYQAMQPSEPQQSLDGTTSDSPSTATSQNPVYHPLIRKCLDLGASDVIISPLSTKCITTLEICVYKAHRDAAREQQSRLEISSGRKLSWVGMSDQKPYAYLREAMVSGLMSGICRLSSAEDQIPSAHISVSSERKSAIAAAVSNWHFCAHSFSDDELLVAAMLMFQHALSMPELEHWRLSTEQLIRFLVACRTAYNSFVPYHNFRHVVDVLQATFSFLVRIGTLPSYLSTPSTPTGEKSPVAKLLNPFDALTLLITAIGHDVGHPGVNNGFLTTLNTPLAQLYNDRSVLESFHCAAYSQILRRYWPAAFEDRKMRNLMISSILATDMGLHFDYMKKLGDLQEKLQDSNSSEAWNGRQAEEHRSLACSLLIKCADISNVARRHDTALKWMRILSEEVSRQASMENELDIKSSLMAAPKSDMLSLSTAQLGFMNMFAMPLFQGVADIMPAMKYTVEELEINKGLFEHKLQEEKAKQNPDVAGLRRPMKDGNFSPRTRSFVGEKKGGEASTSTAAGGETEATVESPADEASDTPNGTPQTVLEAPVQEGVEQSTHTIQRLDEPAPLNSKDSFYLNGSLSSFDAVRELAHSDPFNCRLRGDSSADKTLTSAGQRFSETTDGSLSGAFAGDWASQATSAATGKHALSPSTQGTSIVSNDSMDRTVGVPTLEASTSPGVKNLDVPSQLEQTTSEEHSSATGSVGKAEGRALKKKPSRFRMKDFPFFRRNKGSSPPFPASDPMS